MVGNTGLQEILNPDFVKHINVELLGHIKTEYLFEMKANLIKISDLTFSCVTLDAPLIFFPQFPHL